MLCEHLSIIENELIESGFKETYRGQAWTHNCREWVYFDVVLDMDKLRQRFDLSGSIKVHENLDPKSGVERGIVCTSCHDGIMGKLSGADRFPE